ncbi:MAG TPA: hypothetical protein ENK70_08600 [Methylophaga sp.]|nr:hypothetical protein [Methylophaga sp.]
MTSTNTFTQSVAANKNFGTNVAVATDWTFYNLKFENTAGSPTITVNGSGTGDINVLNNLETKKSSGTWLTLDLETNDRNLDVDGDVTIITASTIQASSTADFFVGGNWTNGQMFTPNTGTVTFDATDSGNQINNGLGTFYNINFDGVNGDWTQVTWGLDVDGTFNITNGEFIHAENLDVNVAGDFTVADGTTFTKATGSGLVILDGDLVLTDNSTVKQDLGNIHIGTSPDTTYLGADLKANSVTINSGDVLYTDGFEMDIGQQGLTVIGTLNVTDADNNSDTKYESDTTQITTTGDVDIQSGSTFTDNDWDSTITFDGTGATTDNLTTNSISIANLTVNGAATLDVDLGSAIDVNGNLTITSGELDTVSGSDWDITVGDNWSNTDTFTAQNAMVTFDATDSGHTINPGSSSFYDLTFNGSGGVWSPLTNTVTVTNDLIMMAGTFNTSSGTANVTVNGDVECLTTCGTIDMATAGTNTFTQSVSSAKNFGTNLASAVDWVFYNLTFDSSSGTPTITINSTGTGEIDVTNNFSLTNNSTSLTLDNETNDRILDVANVSIGAGTTLQASSTAAFNVSGNWANNGDFTDGTGIVTLDGTAQQTVSGQLTGASDRFNNLTITNASAANPDVIFSAAADTAGTFLANTASTQLQFLAGGTYTFQNIDFDGQATGTRVFLRSSSTDTQWNINVAGTRSVSNTDVRDSNACGQPPDIDATDGTNFNSTNNDCWLFETLTFAISDNAIGFGDLSSSQATWATGDGAGSASAVAAHNLQVTTNARGGYIVTYNGSTLTSGSDTITVGDWDNDVNGTPGTEEFAISVATDGDATIAAGYAYAGTPDYELLENTTTTIASETGPTALETFSIYYIANIASITESGNYSTSITYIVTSTF